MDPSISSTKLQMLCRNLRSKEMYYQSPGQAEDEFSSGIYWCGKTSENFGPDSQPVGKTECCAGRSCYVG
jgi:hypothetical protein